ncbi:sushi, von Willebrand factor type A, EGF and pentraxin domain-containing protein 1-like isoform X2 [Lytechinus pictus]|uniref:sushi, von Willebrand factor type A, EGF and pentraxin domain-containing protein 1-like isoform X2 n=1 Tax=Lytechinus pictus TaxID=7653 RepID=UPI0030B9BAD2
MSNLSVLIGFVLLWGGLISISGVKGNCATDCTASECCYDAIPVPLGDVGGIEPVQVCYTSGSTVNYTCTGNLRGPPNQICNNGAWSYPFAPTCEGVTSCPQPTVPSDGSINPDHTQYDLYTRIYYACNEGFSLVGPDEAVCESGGTWNPSTTPSCEASCDKPTLANGYVDPDKTSYMNGEVLNYECNTNYTLVGVSTTTCRNGVYDPSTLPTCFSMCSPHVVENSDYNVQQPPVDHASTITIECDQGYSTGTGTDQDLTCNDGNFNDDPPVCYENCPPLSATFDNGNRSGDTTPFYHEEQVSYRCNTGYSLVGSPVITCNDGKWTDDEPVCKVSGVKGDCATDCTASECCYDAIPVPLGDVGGIEPVQVCYTSGSTVNYTCTGNLRGPPNQICNNGAWSYPFAPTCEGVPSCLQPTVPSDGSINPDHTQYGLYTRIYYACNEGFSLVGPDEAVCESGGTWNPSTTPSCEASCDKPTLANGYVDPDKTSYMNGEVLNYECNTNYTLVGVSTTTCRNGVYDPSTLPTCFSMCSPRVVENSDYNVQQPPVDHASTITIECDHGYSTGTGTEQDLTCNDGNFNDDPPVCYENCPPLSATFDNGVRSGDTTPFYHEEQVSYLCNTGYSLVGSPVITCNDGEWTDDEPVCKGKPSGCSLRKYTPRSSILRKTP